MEFFSAEAFWINSTEQVVPSWCIITSVIISQQQNIVNKGVLLLTLSSTTQLPLSCKSWWSQLATLTMQLRASSHHWNQTEALHLLNYNWCHVQQLHGCTLLFGVQAAAFTSESPQTWALQEEWEREKIPISLFLFHLQTPQSICNSKKTNY